jgi:hypothetical protein
MPEINSYSFKYQEVIEALIKKAGLHEGKWQLTMTFGLAAANMGPNQEELVPGAAVAVTSIGLQKASSESPDVLTADAAAVNPASTASQQPASQSERASRTKA